MVQALESQVKGNSAPSIMSLVVSVERMRPATACGSVLCVPFCALTLMGERKGWTGQVWYHGQEVSRVLLLGSG